MHRGGVLYRAGEGCTELGGDAEGWGMHRAGRGMHRAWGDAQSQEDALVQELLLVSPGARRVGAGPALHLHSPTR